MSQLEGKQPKGEKANARKVKKKKQQKTETLATNISAVAVTAFKWKDHSLCRYSITVCFAVSLITTFDSVQHFCGQKMIAVASSL